jgi:hypothetical protein
VFPVRYELNSYRVDRGKLPNFWLLNAMGGNILGIFISYKSDIY